MHAWFGFNSSFYRLTLFHYYYYDSQISLSIKNPLDKLDNIIRFYERNKPSISDMRTLESMFLLTKCSLLNFLSILKVSHHSGQ